MGIILSEELKEKIEFYEKYYFSLDDPTPFRKDIKVYPVVVKDYYKFYSLLPCLTMNKNVKMTEVTEIDPISKEEKTILKEVSNPQGMSMSYMAYLCEMMADKKVGPTLTAQVINLMEMTLHIKNGLYCPHCHSEDASIDFTDVFERINKVESQEEKLVIWQELSKCPQCGENRREMFCIRDNGRIKKFCIGDYECSPKDFEELIAIITHQNILGYDDDIYIDPELKKDLDLKRKLQNQDFHSPTLEKQIVAVAISTGFTPQMIKEEFTMRKLSFMLKLVDSKEMYYAMKQGQFSGMVSFKQEPSHWIYSDADGFGRDITKELKSLDDFKQKLGDAV